MDPGLFSIVKQNADSEFCCFPAWSIVLQAIFRLEEKWGGVVLTTPTHIVKHT